ncbi:MAG TPA: hypothetical protein DCE41_15405 [Cytophagales bacterium]|nr:hypothetical protein [Cytophagales bacterium]HAA20653.1 hypothetical protein [Cytophagales bacterium]HAP59378.1 hypothetical protein [Cytophagales bacterium]
MSKSKLCLLMLALVVACQPYFDERINPSFQESVETGNAALRYHFSEYDPGQRRIYVVDTVFKADTTRATIMSYHINLNRWEILQHAGQVPAEFRNQGLQEMYFDRSTRELVFITQSLDVLRYSLEESQWEYTVIPNKPPNRAGAGTFRHRTGIFLAGGRSGVCNQETFQFLTDLWYFEGASNTWNLLSDSIPPEGREFYIGIASEDLQNVYLMGGRAYGRTDFPNVWRYHLPTREWSVIRENFLPPGAFFVNYGWNSSHVQSEQLTIHGTYSNADAGDICYFIGETPHSVFMAYNPTTNQMEHLTPNPEHTLGSIIYDELGDQYFHITQGRVLRITQNNTTIDGSTLEPSRLFRYNPNTDIWQNMGVIPNRITQ